MNLLALPEREMSFWRLGVSEPAYPALREDLEVDTVIVGGGISGLTAAYLLKQAGLKVVVLDRSLIGGGTTGHTTGKVTAQHGIVYDDLRRRTGDKNAHNYAQANQAAIGQIEKIIKKHKIDCGWRRLDSYVFTDKWNQIQNFKVEASSACWLGLNASFETELPLPFKVRGAVKLPDQATLHIQRYIEGLARAIDGDGSHVFENSRAVGIRDGQPCRVRTAHASVLAKDIIVATNVPSWPLAARAAYCALEYPHTSYIVACRTKKEFDGMYISPDKDHYSILPVEFGGERLVLVGGESHITGHGRALPRHQKLADYAFHNLEATSIAYRWGARDYTAYDGIPLVGKMYPWSDHLYVATAFKKWGLTNTMAAATILRDLITGKNNPWAETFDSLRPGPVRSIPRVIKNELM